MDWHRNQAPRFLEAWDHWVQHSDFTPQQTPISSNNLRSLPDAKEESEQSDTCQMTHPTVQPPLSFLMSRYNLPANIPGMELTQPLQNMNARPPITRTNGLTYDRFLPVGFHTHSTMSWIHMPLILQAANGVIPVIDLLLPPDLTLHTLDL